MSQPQKKACESYVSDWDIQCELEDGHDGYHQYELNADNGCWTIRWIDVFAVFEVDRYMGNEWKVLKSLHFTEDDAANQAGAYEKDYLGRSFTYESWPVLTSNDKAVRQLFLAGKGFRAFKN